MIHLQSLARLVAEEIARIRTQAVDRDKNLFDERYSRECCKLIDIELLALDLGFDSEIKEIIEFWLGDNWRQI